MINIPIYRANRIDSDDWVGGYMINISNKNCIITNNAGLITDYSIEYSRYGSDYYNCIESDCFIEINPNTLAIHFPNMIDSQGNKIFASLNEDGVGGDNYTNEDGENDVFIFDSCGVLPYFEDYQSFTIIGIKDD